MKYEKYTILILPDNEATGKSIPVTSRTLNILKLAAIILVGLIIAFSALFLPKAFDYAEINAMYQPTITAAQLVPAPFGLYPFSRYWSFVSWHRSSSFTGIGFRWSISSTAIMPATQPCIRAAPSPENFTRAMPG